MTGVSSCSKLFGRPVSRSLSGDQPPEHGLPTKNDMLISLASPVYFDAIPCPALRSRLRVFLVSIGVIIPGGTPDEFYRLELYDLSKSGR